MEEGALSWDDPIMIAGFIAAGIADLAWPLVIVIVFPIIGLPIAACALAIHYAIGIALLGFIIFRTKSILARTVMMIAVAIPLPLLFIGLVFARFLQNKFINFLATQAAIIGLGALTGGTAAVAGEAAVVGEAAVATAEVAKGAATVAEGAEAVSAAARAGEVAEEAAQAARGAEGVGEAAEGQESLGERAKRWTREKLEERLREGLEPEGREGEPEEEFDFLGYPKDELSRFEQDIFETPTNSNNEEVELDDNGNVNLRK